MSTAYPSNIGRSIGVREIVIPGPGFQAAEVGLEVDDPVPDNYGIGVFIRAGSEPVIVGFEESDNAGVLASGPIVVPANTGSELIPMAQGRASAGAFLWLAAAAGTTAFVTLVNLWPVELVGQSDV